jgi:hypothetical protein
MPDVKVPYGEPGDLTVKTVDEKTYEEGPRDDYGDLIDRDFKNKSAEEKLSAWIDHFNTLTGVMDARALKAARAAAGIAATVTPDYAGFKTVKGRQWEAIITPEEYDKGPRDARGNYDPNFASKTVSEKDAAWAKVDAPPEILQAQVDEADTRSDFRESGMFDPIPLGGDPTFEREHLENLAARRNKGWVQRARQRLGINRADTLVAATSSTLKSKGK